MPFNNTEKTEKKNYGERKAKKAYIAWDDNDSSEGSEKEEINLLKKNYESEEDDYEKV